MHQMRALHPAENVNALYDARVPDYRFAAGPNWVDDGASSPTTAIPVERSAGDPRLRRSSLRELIAEPLESGWVHYFQPYEAIHEENLERVLGRAATRERQA